MRLRVPETLAAVATQFRLSVLDQNATCTAAGDADGTALPDLNGVVIQVGTPNEIQVSPGTRTFFVVASDAADNDVARGCARVESLQAGREYDVDITLYEYPPRPDAGMPDSGGEPDSGMVEGDSCAAPIPLPADSPQGGTTEGADDDLGASCGGGGRPDVVYTFTTTVAQHATVTVLAPTAAVTASLRGDCATPGSEVACAGPDGGGTTLIDVGNLPAGTYFVIVDAVDIATQGAFTITAHFEAPTAAPPNDTCAAPELLVPGTATAGTLVDAAGDATGSCGGAGPDAFYELTLDAPQRVELQVTTDGFDPVVYVRTACGDPGAEVGAGCGNDEAGTSEWHGIRELPMGTYYVGVDSTGASGAFTVTATLYPPPPDHDLCAGAEALVSGVTVAGATADANDDLLLSCAPASGLEVFYTFTLMAAAHVTLTLDDVAGEHALALRDGCGGGAASLSCRNTVGTAESIDVPALGPGTYVVVVEGVSGGGSFDLTLVEAPPINPADECSTVETLAIGATRTGSLAGADDDDAGSCGGAGGDDEVYSFFLGTARHVTVSSGAAFPHVIHLRSACADSGSEVACAASAPSGAATLDLGNLPAGTHYVWLDRTGAGDGSDGYTLRVDDVGPPVLPPGNDQCSGAATLASGAVAGTLLNGADDTATLSCGGAGGVDVYYTFTIAQPRRVRATVNAPGTPFDPVVSLRADCADAGSEVACANGSTGATETLEVMSLPAGTYTLVVDGASASTGPFTIVFELLDPPPANDSCDAPATLPVGTLTGQTVAGAADHELGSGACASVGKTDVVYTFTTAADQRAQITVTSTFNAAVYLRGGDCTTDGADVACANAAPATELIDRPFLAAGTYYVVVESMSGAGTTFDISLALLPPVIPGDGCSSPESIATTGAVVSGTTIGKADDGSGSCGGGGADAVYSFTTTGPRRLQVSASSGGTFEYALYLRASPCAGGVEQQCDASSAGSAALDVLNAPAGTYYVFVDALSGAGGSFDLQVTATTAVPPPANDTCSAPAALPAGAGTLFGANDDYVTTCNPTGGVEDVYTFTIAQRSRVTVGANGGAGNVAVALAGTCGVLASELGCANATGSGSETLTIEDLPAGTYYVYVEGVGGFAGSFTPSISVTAPPANDACAGATPLTSGAILTGQTLAVADDTTSGSCAGAGTTRDVLYTFTLASRSVVDLVAGNTALNTTIALQATCGTAATEVACSAATSPGETARFVDLAAGTYTVVVDAPAGSAGGTFDLTYTASAVPDNNSCAAPAPVTLGATTSGTLAGATHEYSGACGGAAGEVVYTFDLATARRLRATVTPTSGSYDPVVYLRSACAGPGSDGCVNAAGTGAAEVLDLDTVAAGTWYLVVDSASGGGGGFDLLVEDLPIPPANDRCAGTITLPEATTLSGTTVGARGDTTGSCSAGGNEVFYTFTLATARRVVVTLTPAAAQHAVYLQGTCASSGTEQGCTSTAALGETLDVLNLGAGTWTLVVEDVSGSGGTFDVRYDTFAPVANDACSAPITLVDGTPRVGDSSVGALDQEQGSCAGAGTTPDLVYTYTLSQARHVNLQVTSTYDAAVSLRTPTCVDEPSETTCLNGVAGAGAETIDIRNQAAGTYYVVVDGVGNSSGTTDVTFTTSAPPPAGDWCPEVVALSTGTTTGQVVSATYAHDESGSCGGAGRDRVYSFSVVGNKHVNIVTQGTIAHALYLRSTTCQTGTEQGCAASVFGGGVNTGTLDFPNLPGGTYYLFVDAAAAGDTGSFDITLTVTAPAAAPPNDQCSSATLLAEGLAQPGTLDGAANDTTVSCGGSGDNDVFYRIDLATNRYITITLTSATNTSLTLRGGTCAAPTEVACVNATGTGEQLIQENLAAGSYYLVVEGIGGAAGAFNIGYTTAAPIVRPPNDACAGAIALASGVPRVGDTVVNALDHADGGCGDLTSGDVVYGFTIPPGSNQRARITVSNATAFDPVLYVQSGSCGGAELGCAQGSTGSGELLDLPNLAPGNYWVWVDELGGGTGTFDILLELLPAVPPPANDICSAAEPLAAGVAENGSTVGATDDYSLTCVTFDGRDTVYSFSTAALGARAVLVTLTPLAPVWDAAIALRDGAACTTTTDLSCVADGYDKRYINRPNLPAGSYDVVVDGDGAQTGDYGISYEVRPADATYGYWAIESTGTFTTINGAGGTSLAIPLSVSGSLSPGDEWTQGIVLPFAFDYYGTSYASVTATSNGFLTFGTAPSGAESYDNDCPLGTSIPNDTIALFWDDGIAQASYPSMLLTKTEGSAPNRRFIIEYRDFDLLSCSGTGCFVMNVRMSQQVILYESGDLEFRYGPRNPPSTSKNCTGGNGGATTNHHLGWCATIGIEGQVSGATDADQVQCDTITPQVTDGRVITFVHPR